MGKTIKLSFSDKTIEIIDKKAEEIGLKSTTYCFNLIIKEIMVKNE